MSNLESKAVDILDKLEAITTQYAPDVVDKAVQSVAVTGISNLVWGLVGFAALYFTWFATKRLVSFFVRKKESGGYWSDWQIGYVLSFVVGAFVCFVLALSSVWTVFDVWNWVAIFNPELAMAHKILGL